MPSPAFLAWLDTLAPVALSREAAIKAKKRAALAERRRVADPTRKPARKLAGAALAVKMAHGATQRANAKAAA